MILSFEWLLILGIAGFYILDSACLLSRNEVIVRGGLRHFDYTLAGHCYSVNQRYLYIPNILMPYLTIFRLRWLVINQSQSSESQQKNKDIVLTEFVKRLRVLQVMIFLLWWLLLVVLPVSILTVGFNQFTLGVFISIYVLVGFILALIFFKRNQLGITIPLWLKMVVDSLLCVPMSLNLLRKICLQQSIKQDGVLYIAEYLTTQDRKEFIEKVLLDIQFILESQDDTQSVNYQKIKLYDDQLKRRW